MATDQSCRSERSIQISLNAQRSVSPLEIQLLQVRVVSSCSEMSQLFNLHYSLCFLLLESTGCYFRPALCLDVHAEPFELVRVATRQAELAHEFLRRTPWRSFSTC